MTKAATQPYHYARAASYALSGFTAWAFGDALLKFAGTEGVPQGETMFISALSGMVVILVISGVRGKIGRLQPRRWKGLFALGLCQWMAYICWLAAIVQLPLANMYVVAFMTPMTVGILAALLLKEHLGWKRGLAIASGFVGVVIAVNPLGLLHKAGAFIPYISVFGSMLGTATQMLALRVVSQKETTECTSFYPRMVLLVAGAISCGATGFVSLKPTVFMALCASGGLGGFGWALMSKAYKNAPAAAVAPFHYSQMITGVVLGYLIWHDKPTPYLLAGAAVIISSGIYLVRHERRASRMMVRAE